MNHRTGQLERLSEMLKEIQCTRTSITLRNNGRYYLLRRMLIISVALFTIITINKIEVELYNRCVGLLTLISSSSSSNYARTASYSIYIYFFLFGLGGAGL
mmetsp:Transcript_12258/g.20496  ORF Transcript_12258/g.20496 Transcript_12258/m.20496 type:complete len:101 (+) Transcript_12258:1197-1499(+)